MFVVKFRKPLS